MKKVFATDILKELKTTRSSNNETNTTEGIKGGKKRKPSSHEKEIKMTLKCVKYLTEMHF